MAIVEPRDDFLRIEFFDQQLNLRIFLDEIAEEHRQQRWHYGWDDAEPEFATDKSFFLINNILDTAGFIDYAFGLGHDFLSDVGQLDWLFAAIKNQYAKLILDLLDLHAECGLCHK